MVKLSIFVELHLVLCFSILFSFVTFEINVINKN